jgi:hypothetical protein
VDRDEWILDQAENYYEHHGRDFSDEQLDWLGYIWDTYADEDGDIDWNKSGD